MTLGTRFALAWVSLIASLTLLSRFEEPNVTAHRSLAVLIGVTGAAVFLLHGGRRISVTGLFALAMALFMGFGGWIVATDDSPTKGLYTALAATACAFALAILFMSSPEEDRTPARPMERGATFLVVYGAGTMVGLVVTRGILPSLLAEGMAFMATVLFAVGIIFGRGRATRWAPLVVIPHLLVYSELFHGSSGRLRLVALFGCLALLYTSRFQRPWHKFALLASLPGALAYLAQDRLAYQEKQFGSAASSGNSGLESMLAPAQAFAALIDAQAAGKAPLQWGTSFLSPLSSLVPSDLRPEWAPRVFNYELVALLYPSRYGTGYSTAGSYFGEWWWNFGVVGIVLAAAMTGPMLGVLDRVIGRGLRGLPTSPRAAVLVCAALAFGGAIADLAWAGPHTWVVRGLSRLPLLAIPFVVALLAASRASGRFIHAPPPAPRSVMALSVAPHRCSSNFGTLSGFAVAEVGWRFAGGRRWRRRGRGEGRTSR